VALMLINRSNSTCTIDVHEPFDEAAKVPFSSYKRCCGEPATCTRCTVARVRSYPTVGPVRVTCIDGAEGDVLSSDEVHLAGGRQWRKSADPPHPQSPVHTVHMIYMNHYDVGYTSYINNVDNM